MPGLVPGIHDFYFSMKTWMAGTSPAMTRKGSEQDMVSAAEQLAANLNFSALAKAE